MYEPVVKERVFLRTRLNRRSVADVWLLHGFAESGFSFREAFLCEPMQPYSLFAPDLPGFGVSPAQPERMSLQGAAEVALNLISELSGNRPVLLVGHSLGAVIATWVARELGEAAKGVFSIEGNLTRSDGYFSAQAAEFERAEEFYRYFLDLVYQRAGGSEAYQRYFASVRLAHPEAMMAWGRSSAELGEAGAHGRDFASLSCEKLYYWGKESTPEETQRFIAKHHIANEQYTGAGHWPMIDKPHECYGAIDRFFAGVLAVAVTGK